MTRYECPDCKPPGPPLLPTRRPSPTTPAHTPTAPGVHNEGGADRTRPDRMGETEMAHPAHRHNRRRETQPTNQAGRPNRRDTRQQPNHDPSPNRTKPNTSRQPSHRNRKQEQPMTPPPRPGPDPAAQGGGEVRNHKPANTTGEHVKDISLDQNLRGCMECGGRFGWSASGPGRPPSFCSEGCRLSWRRRYGRAATRRWRAGQ